MNIPDSKECIKLLEENNVAANIVEHSRKVTQVALFIARELKKNGEKINFALLEAAAMLHDIDKLKTLDKDEQHGKVGFEILKEQYPEVAELVKKHHLAYILDDQLQNWEEKVLNLSDARILEDEVVSLDKRFEYIRNRYPDITGGRREEMEKLYHILEKEVFKKIKLKPEKLAKAIEEQKQKQKKLRQFRKKQKEQKQEEPLQENKEEPVQEPETKEEIPQEEQIAEEQQSEPISEVSSEEGEPAKPKNN